MGDLTYRGTDIQSATTYFDIYRGLAEPPEVRGRDLVIPGRTGRLELNRVADTLTIELRGYVRGTGASEVARQQSWRSATDALMALLDRTLSPGPLVALAPYLGLASGSRTIDARCTNIISGEIRDCYTLQLWSIELEAVDPPEWS